MYLNLHPFKKIAYHLWMVYLCGIFVIVSPQKLTFAQNRELVILNWNDYVEPDLIQTFEKQFQAKIRQVHFETDETRDKILATSAGREYDIWVANDLAVSKYIKAKWIDPINRKKIPNLKHLDPRMLRLKPEYQNYAIPYFWGVAGIAYRKDLVGKKVNSWKQFYQPSEELRNKILMVNDSKDAVGFALLASGYTEKDFQNSAALKQAEHLLMQQKPYVQQYSYIALKKEHSLLVKGTVAMAFAYNGDGLTLEEHHPEIEFVIPEEGTILWTDYMVISNRAKNKELAHAYINFINEPKNAAQNAQFVYFASPNVSAVKLLPKEFINNPKIYPPSQIMQHSFYFPKLSPRMHKKWNQIFSKVIQ